MRVFVILFLISSIFFLDILYTQLIKEKKLLKTLSYRLDGDNLLMSDLEYSSLRKKWRKQIFYPGKPCQNSSNNSFSLYKIGLPLKAKLTFFKEREKEKK